MRALPADSLEYLGDTADGNTAFPVAAGAGAAAGFTAGFGDGVSAGGGAVGGASVASVPHWAFRKLFHFIPFRVPASLAALYFALHSFIERARAGAPCRARAIISAPTHTAMYRIVIIKFLVLPDIFQDEL